MVTAAESESRKKLAILWSDVSPLGTLKVRVPWALSVEYSTWLVLRWTYASNPLLFWHHIFLRWSWWWTVFVHPVSSLRSLPLFFVGRHFFHSYLHCGYCFLVAWGNAKKEASVWRRSSRFFMLSHTLWFNADTQEEAFYNKLRIASKVKIIFLREEVGLSFHTMKYDTI